MWNDQCNRFVGEKNDIPNCDASDLQQGANTVYGWRAANGPRLLTNVL